MSFGFPPRGPADDARIASYYGPAASVSPAPDMSAAASYYGPPAPPPAPPVDAGPLYDYRSPPPDIAAPPPPGPPIRPVGAQLSQVGNPQTAPFSAPAPPAPPPAPFQPPPVATDASIPPPIAAQTEGGLGRISGTTLGAAPLSSTRDSGPGPKLKPATGGPVGSPALSKATAALRGTYDDDKGALQRGASADEARAGLLAQGGQELARKKQDDQAIAQVEAANAAQHFRDYQETTQRQIDDVRRQKIEPNRLYADDGAKAIAIFGGVLGGMYQGMNKLTSNPFIDQMNKDIDRDIAVQEKNLSTQKESIGERRSLLSEMRATYKDEALAKAQAKNLYYEGAKEELLARAQDYDSPAIQARADQAVTALTRAQFALDIERLQKEAAARGAAASAAEHRRQVDFENSLKLHHAQTEDRKIDADLIKSRADGGKEHRAAVAHVGDKLADVDKEGSGTDLDRLHRYLIDPATGKVDHSRSIPGVGRMADLRETVAPPLGRGGALDVVGALGVVPAAARGGSAWALGLNPEERQNKNAMDRVFLGFKNQKTGTAASQAEAGRIAEAYFGAKTPEEVASAVDQSYQFLQRNRDSVRAENPDATAEFEANRRALTESDSKAHLHRSRP